MCKYSIWNLISEVDMLVCTDIHSYGMSSIVPCGAQHAKTKQFVLQKQCARIWKKTQHILRLFSYIFFHANKMQCTAHFGKPFDKQDCQTFLHFFTMTLHAGNIFEYRYRSIKQANPICVKKTGLSHIIKIYWVPDHYMVSFPLALPECRGLGCAEGSRNGDPKATNQPWENMKSLRDF
jgi:hypothetical protein